MFLLMVFVLASTSPLIRAQWIPVSGTVSTRTEVLASDGSISSKWTTVSTYARSASGSVLTQRIGRSGKPAGGTLLDYGRTQKAYSIGYHAGQVTEMHRPLDKQLAAQPPTSMNAAQQSVSMGKSKIKGVDCFLVPLYDTGPNRSRVLIGKAWLAPTYNNLVLREEFTRTLPDGSKRHVVREMQITDTTEPDPALFSTDRAKVAAQWKVAGAK